MRAAAGAALSRLFGRHVARAVGGGGAAAAGETRHRHRGRPVRAGFSTVFVALGASASVIGALMRFYSNELAIIAGVAIIIMGLHFLGLTPIALPAPAGAHSRGKARRALGRVCDGACVCARLDAVHRADPGGNPGGRGIKGHGRQGRGPACRLFARARRAVHHRRASRSSRLPRSSPAFAPISPMSSG